MFVFTYTHAHFVYCLLKARPEISFALISSKMISVDKPEHGLERNEIIGLIPSSLSNITLSFRLEVGL